MVGCNRGTVSNVDEGRIGPGVDEGAGDSIAGAAAGTAFWQPARMGRSSKQIFGARMVILTDAKCKTV